MKHHAPNRCEPSIEFRGGGGGDQGRCEWRSEVFVKFQKNFFFFFFFHFLFLFYFFFIYLFIYLFIYFLFFFFFLGGGGVGSGGRGVRMDVSEELKFL